MKKDLQKNHLVAKQNTKVKLNLDNQESFQETVDRTKNKKVKLLDELLTGNMLKFLKLKKNWF